MGRRITGRGVEWVHDAMALALRSDLLGAPLVRAALFLAAAAWHALPPDRRQEFDQMAREAQRMVARYGSVPITIDRGDET